MIFEHFHLFLSDTVQSTHPDPFCAPASFVVRRARTSPPPPNARIRSFSRFSTAALNGRRRIDSHPIRCVHQFNRIFSHSCSETLCPLCNGLHCIVSRVAYSSFPVVSIPVVSIVCFGTRLSIIRGFSNRRSPRLHRPLRPLRPRPPPLPTHLPAEPPLPPRRHRCRLHRFPLSVRRRRRQRHPSANRTRTTM